MCLLEILCTISLFIYHLVWCDRQRISIMGLPHRRTPRVVLVYHKVVYTNTLPITNKQIFSYRIEKVVSLKSLPLNIGRISIWCAQPAAYSPVSWLSRTGWAPFDYPVASRQAELSCCLPRFVLVDYFGIQPSPNYSAKPASADLRFTGIWGSVTSTMLSLSSADANTPRV